MLSNIIISGDSLANIKLACRRANIYSTILASKSEKGEYAGYFERHNIMHNKQHDALSNFMTNLGGLDDCCCCCIARRLFSACS